MAAIPGARLLSAAGRMLVHPRLWTFLLRPRVRYAFAWLLAVTTAGLMLHHSWTFFDTPERPDKNCGHVFIDFGGQYVMGRMIVEGHARDLYNRNVQRKVISRAYPREDEAPLTEHTKEEREGHDDENLMFWFMGDDDPAAAGDVASVAAPLAARQPLQLAAVIASQAPLWESDRLRSAMFCRGGPLYPPITGFLYYPLARLRAQPAYRITQLICLALAFLAGLGVSVISRGRVWWPLAATAVIVFPGFEGNLNLGQNATLTLALLVWGWALLARGRPVAGGVLWGLLAFKPVWAVAFLFVPLFTGRWRMALAMLLTGAGLAALTLPFVGWHVWYDWFKIGQDAADLYRYDRNWIYLGRDLLSLPRKWMDMSASANERHENLAALLVGWGALGLTLETTLRMLLVRRSEMQATTGAGPAFLLLSAWLLCYHFMYYDVLLAFLPAALLFTEPRRYLEPWAIAIMPLRGRLAGSGVLDYLMPGRAASYPDAVPLPLARPGNIWVLNRLVPTLLVTMALIYPLFPYTGPPVDMYCLIALWVWCGWLVGSRWEARNPPPAQPVPLHMDMPVEVTHDGVERPLEAEPVP